MDEKDIEIVTDGENKNVAPVSLVEPVWEQQAHFGESDEEFTMFLYFASLHPSQRSIQKAWESWSQKDTYYSSTFLQKYVKYQWKERAAAWDIYRLKNAHQDWIMRDNERRTADFEIGELFRKIAKERLQDLDGTYITANTAARFAELASKLQESAVPDISLQQDDLKNLMTALPDDRRKEVIAILVARYNK